MKKTGIIVILMVILALLTVGCSKKTMENQSSADEMESTQPEEQQNEPIAEPEPDLDTQAIDEDQAQRDETANLNAFTNEYIYFDFDSAVLRSDAMETLRTKAQWLEENAAIDMLVIEGHCDERGTDAYNMALGAQRADAVKQYLIDLGLTSERLQTQSYGEERPLDPGHNEEAWAKNRRAAFVINQ
jgi:peptidoglycan-associated lipoprotein